MLNKTKSNPRAVLKALFFLPLIVLMMKVLSQKENNSPGPVNVIQPDNKYLLPIQVNMAEPNINGRLDTVVFWFLPTPSLKKALSPIVNVDDYLQICPPDTRKVEAKRSLHR